MKKLTALAALTLAFGCADAVLVEPEPDARPAVAFDRATNMPGALEFFAEITFVATLGPGETNITPSGVIHRGDVVNEWAMTGDLVGPWYFVGDVHVNPNSGNGVAVGTGIWFDIQSSKWGMAGTFECNNVGNIRNFPTPDFIMTGNLSGCKGAGDFAGMRFWGAFTNEDSPGPPVPGSPSVYDFHGVIW